MFPPGFRANSPGLDPVPVLIIFTGDSGAVGRAVHLHTPRLEPAPIVPVDDVEKYRTPLIILIWRIPKLPAAEGLAILDAEEAVPKYLVPAVPLPAQKLFVPSIATPRMAFPLKAVEAMPSV